MNVRIVSARRKSVSGREYSIRRGYTVDKASLVESLYIANPPYQCGLVGRVGQNHRLLCFARAAVGICAACPGGLVIYYGVSFEGRYV